MSHFGKVLCRVFWEMAHKVYISKNQALCISLKMKRGRKDSSVFFFLLAWGENKTGKGAECVWNRYFPIFLPHLPVSGILIRYNRHIYIYFFKETALSIEKELNTLVRDCPGVPWVELRHPALQSVVPRTLLPAPSLSIPFYLAFITLDDKHASPPPRKHSKCLCVFSLRLAPAAQQRAKGRKLRLHGVLMEGTRAVCILIFGVIKVGQMVLFNSLIRSR